jgi:hypothetical protein
MKQNVLNKLNGLAMGEEGFVQLEQKCSTTEQLTLDLADVLMQSDVFKGLNVGEDCLINFFTIEPASGKLIVSVNKGKVERVENKAFLTNLSKALVPQA